MKVRIVAASNITAADNPQNTAAIPVLLYSGSSACLFVCVAVSAVVNNMTIRSTRVKMANAANTAAHTLDCLVVGVVYWNGPQIVGGSVRFVERVWDRLGFCGVGGNGVGGKDVYVGGGAEGFGDGDDSKSISICG